MTTRRELLRLTGAAIGTTEFGRRWPDPEETANAIDADAAATAKLLRLDADHTMWAMGLGIAGGGGLFQYYFDQTEEKKLHVARTVRMGVESAQLAGKGYAGPRNIVEGASGLLPSYLRGNGRTPYYAAMKRDLRQFEGPLYVYPKFTSTSITITAKPHAPPLERLCRHH